MISALAAIFATLSLASIGAIVGVFFAFSTSVMPGLDAIEGPEAIRAMQSLNRKILNPLFLTTFVLAAITPIVTGLLLLAHSQAWAGVLFLIAAALYVVGAFGTTIAISVPMNEALAELEAPVDVNAAARMWADYSVRWTQWNWIRTIANLLSLFVMGLALFVWGRHG